MNKKILFGSIAVFIAIDVLNFLIHGVMLSATYQSLSSLWRPDMMSKMWITHVNTAISAFFFTFVFSKGYEGKGVAEGVRYGFYIGFWLSALMAYGTYMMIAIPYPLAVQWFIYGLIQYVVAGVVLALVFAAQTKGGQKA
ncbi:MAG: hypothetical protein NTZ35_10525 [Ignavibacteriales bacterium]|nr:hypothetical protein [Ignavibacteriales bacterium]